MAAPWCGNVPGRMNIYESEKLLGEYLLFHYATADEILPYPFGPRDALHFPTRCASECVDRGRLAPNARALDLGCAVGRSTFELARYCASVTGVDFSRRFIEAATHLRESGRLQYQRIDEGELTTPLTALVPPDIDRARVRFEVGDASDVDAELGAFDIVLLANVIDRLREPQRCLRRLAALVKPGGRLMITSPYSWSDDFTVRENWIGGYAAEAGPIHTLQGLTTILSDNFELLTTKDMPFLIREHARKFQWSVAQASIWLRR